jgi:hypothetical protein
MNRASAPAVDGWPGSSSLCHSDRSRTLSEAEGDGGAEEPAAFRIVERNRVERRRSSAAFDVDLQPMADGITTTGCPISRVFCEKWGFFSQHHLDLVIPTGAGATATAKRRNLLFSAARDERCGTDTPVRRRCL